MRVDVSADVSILGAGPVGCTLALLLQRQGRSVALVRQRKEAPAPFRPIALSHASRLILERAGAWGMLSSTPITSIHVSQQGGFGRTRMSAADAGVPALGYVVDYAALLDALLALASERNIPFQAEPAEALLAVHAEGTSDEITRKEYGQEAVVAQVTTRPGAVATAWERFTPDGPLALRVRATRVGERSAFIGNAAQTLHPVAGQGLNLGLRDAWDLAQVLHGAEDPGDARLLQGFAALRRFDATATVRVTDFLAGAFLGTHPLSRLTRGFGLTALDICLPARRFFARRMIYGASALP